MNDPSQMRTRPYGMWQAHPYGPLAPAEVPAVYQNYRSVFLPTGSEGGRFNWKIKKAADKRKKAKNIAGAPAGSRSGAMVSTGGSNGFSGYKPPALNELQWQNRVKARRFYTKKKFDRFAPYAPRNTTSFIIRAKRSGGIAPLISPCTGTPAILPTPTFSASIEKPVDMAREEFGLDGYGSMKGLIRLRSPTQICEDGGGGMIEEEDDVECGSSESDVEELVEMERRLDHDLSKFEILYPTGGDEQRGAVNTGLLNNIVYDEDDHINDLEDENLSLRERLFWMEREMNKLKGRLQALETGFRLQNAVHNITNKKNVDDDDHGAGNGADGNNFNSLEAVSENVGNGDFCSEKIVGD